MRHFKNKLKQSNFYQNLNYLKISFQLINQFALIFQQFYIFINNNYLLVGKQINSQQDQQKIYKKLNLKNKYQSIFLKFRSGFFNQCDKIAAKKSQHINKNKEDKQKETHSNYLLYRKQKQQHQNRYSIEFIYINGDSSIIMVFYKQIIVGNNKLDFNQFKLNIIKKWVLIQENLHYIRMVQSKQVYLKKKINNFFQLVKIINF
ncbi:hypothetical protein TTHERM_001318424 (macronuclear) [Tetrahymena thermophila SB210]|uniref:Uncharacterized protein n=1 Tax=Tetrahymena thermophila (strain SB210) TaxID=312017 RepID=W7XDC9_TETTS|nr:hypothetical protein TTHERM_001318424 [Tetrahymena thermophila SB210]EWS71811.1 hypothetical protein TTHERM_001318424 [Tetrahymena thermophila SB210]|eukprot:XP_012655652.1 hypothetical protein TTHERM_001318424 [Tetrahymena thermophila SB210]